MNKSFGTNQSLALNQGLLPSKISPPESPPLPPVSPEGKAKVDMLLVQVDALPASENSSLIERQLNALQEACILTCSDAETLKYAVERLHRVCLKKKSMCSKVAILCNAVSSLEVEGLRFRSELLTRLQEDYEVWQKMQVDSPDRFLNAAALLCEVFTKVRSNNTPISVLSKPVLDYLEALLSGDEKEIELFANLVALTGNDLKNVAELNFQKLLIKIRDTLKSRNLSSQCRLWLLWVLDMSNRYFHQSFSDIDDFYKEHLGLSSCKLVELIKTSQLESQISTDPDSVNLPPENKSRHEVDEPIGTEKVSQMKISNSSVSKSERSFHSGEHHTLPTKSDVDKRENFRVAIQSNSNANKGKYWLHDDRFEKESSTKTSTQFSKPSFSAGNWRQGNKSGRDTVGQKDSRESHSSKGFNSEKESWRKAPANQVFSPVQVECEENWDD